MVVAGLILGYYWDVLTVFRIADSPFSKRLALFSVTIQWFSQLNITILCACASVSQRYNAQVDGNQEIPSGTVKIADRGFLHL